MFFNNIRFVLFMFLFDLVVAKPGDRAKAECRRNGEQMIECQRMLYGAKTRVPADLLEFPHMALIGFKSDKDDKYKWNCGGTLISSLWVLTAAHCRYDPSRGPAKKVLLGTTSFEEEESEDLVVMRDVAHIETHPCYKPPSKYNDIALLKLNSSVELNKDIRIACLQLEHETPKSAIASGFGKTNFDDEEGSKTMMRVDLDIIPQKTCNVSLKSLFRKRGGLQKGILTKQLCAGDLKGGKDTCQGDSGGPLQVFPKQPDCKNSFFLYVILGVTSFGRFCGFKNSPGVYTRVSDYIPWIEDIVWP